MYDAIKSSVKSSTDPNMTVINSTVKQCAEKAPAINAEDVLKCFKNDAATIQMQAGKATLPHPGTPFVQVTNHSGSFVFNTSGNVSLLETICENWLKQGGSFKVPAGCPKKQVQKQEDVVVI